MATAFVSATYPGDHRIVSLTTSTVVSASLGDRPIGDAVRLPTEFELPRNIDESKTRDELKSETSGSALGQFLSDQQTQGARRSAMSAMVIPLLQHFHKAELPNLRIRTGPSMYLGGCFFDSVAGITLNVSQTPILWKVDVGTGRCYSTAPGAFGQRTLELVCCPTGSKLTVDVLDGGNGFTSPPTFAVAAPPNGGVQASFQATVNDGAITSVSVKQAAGYVVTPSSVTYGGASATDALASMLRVRVESDPEHVTLFWKRDDGTYCLGTDFIVDVCEDWTLPIMDSPAVHHFAGPTLVEALDVDFVERPVSPAVGTARESDDGIITLEHDDFLRSDVVSVTAVDTGPSTAVHGVRAREGDFTLDTVGLYAHNRSSDTLGSVATAMLIRK